MKKSIEVKTQTVGRNRRNFLKVSGLAVVGSGLLLASCSDDDDNGNMMGGTFDLGTGDVGVLNYAYALEQLEAAFYTNVVNGSFYASANEDEKALIETAMWASEP
ncbi:MAG: ferritin-like domain-containing protein, partial [Leeuwenhoekiella sp.]|nr:ferritin-like domain-containing protein [Leeuwenhoekiella sp.]